MYNKAKKMVSSNAVYWFSYSIVAIFIRLFLSLSTNSTDSLVKIEQHGTSCSPSWRRKSFHIVEIWTKMTHNSVRMQSLTEIMPHHLIYLSARKGKLTNWSHTQTAAPCMYYMDLDRFIIATGVQRIWKCFQSTMNISHPHKAHGCDESA